jgi:hypothetical protein
VSSPESASKSTLEEHDRGIRMSKDSAKEDRKDRSTEKAAKEQKQGGKGGNG